MSNISKSFEKKSALRAIRMADGGLVGKIKSVFDPEDDRSASDKAAGIPKPGSREENEQLSLRVVKKPGVFPTLGRSEMQRDMRREHNERELRMADGGLVDRAASDLASRKSKLDEAENAAVGGQPTAPAKPQPAPAPKPQTDDEKRAAVGMPPKKGLLRTLLGMKEGGHVVGPGGPREDKVPAMLSDGEYVLPAKTVQKLGGPEEIDELVRATNDGREPEGAEERDEGRHTLRKLAGGGFVGPLDPSDPRYRAAQNRAAFPTAGTPPTPPTPPATPPVTPTATAGSPGLASRAARGMAGLAGSALRFAGQRVLPAAVVTQGFGDYTPKDQSVPYDAMSQLRMGVGASQQFLSGDYSGAADTAGKLGKSLSNSFMSTAADVGSGVAKVADGVAGVFGASPGYKKEYDAAIASSPAFSGVQPAAELNSKAGAGRGFVNPPSLGVGDGPEGLRNVAQTTAVPTDAPPSPRNVAQSRFLSEQGVDAATQASAPVRLDIAGTGPNGVVTKNTGLRNVTEPGKFVNLGSFQGPDNIYGTSTKPGGRVDSFVGAGDPNRQESPQTIAAVEKLQNDLAVDRAKTAAREQAEALASATQGNAGSINARFDEMARGVKGSYSAKGKGNESKRLLDIETQRANALEADARNTAMLRGQSLQAQTQYNENATKNREISVRDAERRDALRAKLAGKPLDVAKSTAEQAANEERGAEAVNKAVADSISRRFPGVKDDPTQARQAEALAAFVRQAPPDIINRIRGQNPTEREEGIQLAFNMFDQTQKANTYQADTFRGISSDKPAMARGDARRIQLGDFAGPGSLPITAAPRYLAGIVGADAGKVQELDNGAKVPLTLLTDDEFGKNVTKVSSLAQQRELTRRREEQARIERLKQEIKK